MLVPRNGRTETSVADVERLPIARREPSRVYIVNDVVYQYNTKLANTSSGHSCESSSTPDIVDLSPLIGRV